MSMSENGSTAAESAVEGSGYVQYIVQVCFGIPLTISSLLILLAIVSRPALRSRKELLYFAFLAFGDVCFGSASFLSGVRRTLLTIKQAHTQTVTAWYCMQVPTTLLWFITNYVRGSMMVVISVDRYLAIAHFNWWRVSNDRYPKTVACVVFGHTLVGLFVAVAASYWVKDSQTASILCHSFWAVPHWYNVYVILFALGSGYLSVGIYGFVLRAYKQSKALLGQYQQAGKEQERQRAQQRRFTKTVGLVVLFTLLGNCTFYTAIFVMNFFVADARLFDRVIPVLGAADMLNSLGNMAIYCTRLTEVRAAVVQLLRLRCNAAAVGVGQHPP